MNTINISDIKLKLYQKLVVSGWSEKLKTFILGHEFDVILKTLITESEDSMHFTPKIKQLFRAFEECPYEKTKVILLLQDPYPNVFGEVTAADGIAMSCSNTRKEQPTIRYVFDEIERTIPGKYVRNPDLTRWANQGVLLLNTALTTTVNKVGTHYLIWQPFLAFVLDILSFEKSDLIFVFLGSKAKLWAQSVPENSIKIFCVHPAAAAHNNLESWNSDDLFNKINKYLGPGNEITW